MGDAAIKSGRQIVKKNKRAFRVFLERAEETLSLSKQDSLSFKKNSSAEIQTGIELVAENIFCFVCKRKLSSAIYPPVINVEDTGIFVCSDNCAAILTLAGG